MLFSLFHRCNELVIASDDILCNDSPLNAALRAWSYIQSLSDQAQQPSSIAMYIYY